MGGAQTAIAAVAMAALFQSASAGSQVPAGPPRDRAAASRIDERPTPRAIPRPDEAAPQPGPLRVRVVHTAPAAIGDAGARTARFWAVLEIDAPTARAGAWLAGGSAEVTLLDQSRDMPAIAPVAIPPHTRSLLVSLGTVTLEDEDFEVAVRASPALDGDAIAASVRVPALADGPGVPALLRRGPTTGRQFQPTAHPFFRRYERVRLELPAQRPVSIVEAALLGLNGVAIAVPVRTASREEHGITWAVAEVSLAPLAPGDYALRMTVKEEDDRRSVVVAGFRVVG